MAFGSGRHREKRLQVEECQRLDALLYGVGILREPMPTGGERVRGLCPQCGRAARWLYAKMGKQPACRNCHKLIYKSRAIFGTVADRVKKNPQIIGAALDSGAAWIDGVQRGDADAKQWSDFMSVLSVFEGTGTAPADALTSEIIEEARVPDDATLQARVVASDVAKATRLMESVEKLLENGTENHVNRKGEPSVVPLRSDSSAKLLHAWVALSNLRAARSGVATSISEARATTQKEEGRFSTVDLLHDPEAMSAALMLTEKLAALRKPEK